MELTSAALWLNSFFSGYDKIILSLLHAVACGLLTGLFKLITVIGEKGIVFFAAAIFLMCFRKTRKMGICLFGAVACGALITNIILKDAIARPRPFETVELYRQWWQAIGSPAEDGFSFPSGHVTAAASGMVALRLMKGKKWSVPMIVVIVVMAMARNYLMAHYPSDVLVAAIIGAASAFIAYYITQLIYRLAHARPGVLLWHLVLEYDIPDLAGIPSKLGMYDNNSKEPDTGRRESLHSGPAKRTLSKGVYHGKHEK